MRKVTGIILALVCAGVVLVGCYSKSCDQQQPAPMSYKGETK